MSITCKYKKTSLLKISLIWAVVMEEKLNGLRKKFTCTCVYGPEKRYIILFLFIPVIIPPL